MSIRVMSRVWDSGPEDRGELLVLLALADYCNDEGKCWPSVKSLAMKARMTERGVQKVLGRLVDGGRISIATGRGRHRCNLYTVLAQVPERPPNQVHPELGSPRTPKLETPNPVPKTPNPGSPEPSGSTKDPSIESADALSVRGPPNSFLPRDWVPSDADITYARSKRLLRHEIEEIADEFRRYWSERRDRKARRTADGWRRTWEQRCRDVAPTYIRNRRAAEPNARRGTSMAGIAARRQLEEEDPDDFSIGRWHT